MKISEVISQLETLKEKHGDIQVTLRTEGFGGYSIHSCKSVDESEIDFWSLIEEDRADETLIREFFPEWNGDMETDQNLETKVIEFREGTLIYST